MTMVNTRRILNVRNQGFHHFEVINVVPLVKYALASIFETFSSSSEWTVKDQL